MWSKSQIKATVYLARKEQMAKRSLGSITNSLWANKVDPYTTQHIEGFYLKKAPVYNTLKLWLHFSTQQWYRLQESMQPDDILQAEAWYHLYNLHKARGSHISNVYGY